MSTVKLCHDIRLANIGLKEYLQETIILLVIRISAGNLSCQITDVNFNTIIRVAFYVQKLFTTYSLALKFFVERINVGKKPARKMLVKLITGQQRNHYLLLSFGWVELLRSKFKRST
jgi:hypothetical protein